MKKGIACVLVSAVLCLGIVIASSKKANEIEKQEESAISVTDGETGSTVSAAPATEETAVSTTLSHAPKAASPTSAAKPNMHKQSAAQVKNSPDIQKAIAAVKEKVGTDNGTKTFQYDHEETVDDKTYYVILASYTESGRKTTCGCYLVDTQTGTPYINNLGANNTDKTLIPLN